MFKAGDEIKIIQMVGEPEYTNRTGVIKMIDGLGQLHGTWGGLAVQPQQDKIEILKRA